MPRLEATNFKVALALAARLDALIKASGLNLSRNQLAEQFLEECCLQAEREDGATVPPTVLELRTRQNKKVLSKLVDQAQGDHIQRLAQVERQIAKLLTQAKDPLRKPTAKANEK